MPESNSPEIQKSKFYLKAPAPWRLEGEGIILVYKFSKDWVERFGQVPDDLIGKFKGGLGYLMLVNYKKSPVGPYHELLFIPGKFNPNGKQSITKIYVDSEASTQNGRANWGIPKQTLPISWEEKDGTTCIKISSGESTVFACELRSFGISFPTSTSLLPIDLLQQLNKISYYTKPTGSGWGKLAKLKITALDPAYFPDIRNQKPLLAVKIKPFRINFPLPSYDV